MNGNGASVTHVLFSQEQIKFVAKNYWSERRKLLCPRCRNGAHLRPIDNSEELFGCSNEEECGAIVRLRFEDSRIIFAEFKWKKVSLKELGYRERSS